MTIVTGETSSTVFIFTKDELRDLLRSAFFPGPLIRELKPLDQLEAVLLWVEENVRPAHVCSNQPEPLLTLPSDRVFVMEPEEPNEWYTDPDAAMKKLMKS